MLRIASLGRGAIEVLAVDRAIGAVFVVDGGTLSRLGFVAIYLALSASG